MKKLLNLRISDADRRNIEILRNHGYNVSAFLRYCLKKKADEFRKGGTKMKEIELPVKQLILEYHKKVRDFIESMILEKIYKINEDGPVDNELPD